jgi:hypothetical protein
MLQRRGMDRVGAGQLVEELQIGLDIRGGLPSCRRKLNVVDYGPIQVWGREVDKTSLINLATAAQNRAFRGPILQRKTATKSCYELSAQVRLSL